jgi:glycosyltransferase involved in cell wall biosynthesis
MFVLPSVVADDGQMEGLPVALMEALACGVPTVSTALSGIPEIVVDNVTGLLAIPGDASSLNATLRAITTSDTVGFAEVGRELVTREFDLTQTMSALSDLLLKTCR